MAGIEEDLGLHNMLLIIRAQVEWTPEFNVT